MTIIFFYPYLKIKYIKNFLGRMYIKPCHYYYYFEERLLNNNCLRKLLKCISSKMRETT